MLLVYEKKDITELNFFSFFFFCISPLYTSGFCCSNSIQFLSCSSCSLKKARIKVFKISMWFYCDLPQNHYGLGTCYKFEWDESLHRTDMTEISLSFLSTNQEKLATTSMSRVFPLSLFPALGDRRLHELSAFWLVDLNKNWSDCLLLLVAGNLKQKFSAYLAFSFFFCLILKPIKEYDEFEEWIDGSAKLRYSPYSREAQAHISGWAMKYTNNHNKFVLKKTCVGVLLCSRDCTLPNGLKIVVRPAISDKGKRLMTVLS